MGQTPRVGRMCTWDRIYHYILAHIRPLNHPRAKYLFRFAVCSAQQMLYIKFSQSEFHPSNCTFAGFQYRHEGPKYGFAYFKSDSDSQYKDPHTVLSYFNRSITITPPRPIQFSNNTYFHDNEVVKRELSSFPCP